MTEASKIQPRPTEVSAPFWEGCRVQDLRLQRCQACQTYQFYPRIMCSSCGATELDWQSVSGRGVVASFTIVRRGVSAAYDAPYIVALIDLEEGPRMMSQIKLSDVDDNRLVVGARVVVTFADWSEEITTPLFELEN